jgi:hypothetical protein
MPIPVFARRGFPTPHGPTTNVTNHLFHSRVVATRKAIKYGLLDLELVRLTVAWTNGFKLD